MSEDITTVGHRMAKGATWMVAMRWSVRGIGLISVLILARLLTPDDFGIIAMAMIVVGLFKILTETYVDLALIRNADATRLHYDTAWTLTILQGVGIAIVVVLIAPVAANYFHDPRVTAVIRVLALGILIKGFENIGVVAFRKELNFQREYQYYVSKKIMGFVTTVILAFVLRNYWALAIGMVIAPFTGVLLSYRMHPYRPALSLTKAGDIWSFSRWMLAWRIGQFLNTKTDQFIVGNIAETTSLGSYYMASEVSSAPTDELAMPIGRALFPTYSKLTHDLGSLKAAILNSLGLAAMLVLPVGVGLSAVAEDLVTIVLGSKWLASAPLMEWLAVFGSASALSHILVTPLFVMGRGKLAAFHAWLLFIASVITLSLAAQFGGITQIAVARTVVMFAFLPISFYFLTRACPIAVRSIAQIVWRPIAASIVMWIAVRLLHAGSIQNPLMSLMLDVIMGIMIYCITMFVLWNFANRPKGPEQILFRYIVTFLHMNRNH